MQIKYRLVYCQIHQSKGITCSDVVASLTLVASWVNLKNELILYLTTVMGVKAVEPETTHTTMSSTCVEAQSGGNFGQLKSAS